jgi:inosine-uridine nucleoside N-ribohydrolase
MIKKCLLISIFLTSISGTLSAHEHATTLSAHEHATKSATSNKPVPIIFDTDFGGDADDLGALAMLHNYADKGDIDFLAVTSWANEKNAVQAIDAVNHHYGRPDLPIGVRKVEQWHTDWSYSEPIAQQFAHSLKSSSEAPDAVALYRQLLAKADNNTVVIVTVGPLANIKNLLLSKADKYSRLSGKALVKEKVNKFVIMGGRFPFDPSNTSVEWNFSGNMPGVTKYVLENIPVDVVFSGFEVGKQLTTGSEINDYPKNTPLYVGYKHFSEFAFWMKDKYQGKILDNATFDQTAVMFAAINGIGEHWTLSKPGFVGANEEGINTWREDKSGNHRYMILPTNPNQLEATRKYIIDAMMFKDK